jgi:hypothetical protein
MQRRAVNSIFMESNRCPYYVRASATDAAIEHGAQTGATARMTEDCQKGIAKFLEKDARI